MSLFDLKVIGSVFDELEQERGIPRERVIDAIEMALAAAYKKEYGKRGQIIRAEFNPETGDVDFKQIKIAVDDTLVRGEEEEETEDDERTRFNPEHHIMLEDARRIKKDVELDDEIDFPLEAQEDFGRIAAQTAKQVIMQKIREAEKVSIIEEFGEREGEVVSGHVQRFERGNLFIDLGRATAILPYEEQIPGERYRQGERIRALLLKVDENPRGSTFLRLSRANSDFLVKLFELESPELANGTIEIKRVAREAGSRSKLAVLTHDDHVDPVGALVGQRGVRVSTVTSELGGEKIDIIEWAEDARDFIERALSPAEVLSVDIVEETDEVKRAEVEVVEDQQSLAIGRGGQNVRLAAKLTGWAIDIRSAQGEQLAETDAAGENVEINEEELAENAAPVAEKATAEEVADETGGDEAQEDAAEEATDEVAEESTDLPAQTEETSDDASADTPEEEAAEETEGDSKEK